MDKEEVESDGFVVQSMVDELKIQYENQQTD
jgi:hypothetical protein